MVKLHQHHRHHGQAKLPSCTSSTSSPTSTSSHIITKFIMVGFILSLAFLFLPLTDSTDAEHSAPSASSATRQYSPATLAHFHLLLPLGLASLHLCTFTPHHTQLPLGLASSYQILVTSHATLKTLSNYETPSNHRSHESRILSNLLMLSNHPLEVTNLESPLTFSSSPTFGGSATLLSNPPS